MATPLSELLNAVLTDAGAREQFQLAPETFLRSAGYRDLDAADVQEALFVLADGSEPVRAGQLLAGGRAIGDPADLDGLDAPDGGLAGAGAGLATAIEVVPLDEPFVVDSAADDVDGPDEAASDDAFGSGTTDPTDVDPTDLLDGDAFDARSTSVAAEPLDEPITEELVPSSDHEEELDEFDRPRDEPEDLDDERPSDDWDLD